MELCDHVYRDLWASLSLSEDHRRYLQERRLTDEIIDRVGFKTWPGPERIALARGLVEKFGEAALGVPGLYSDEAKGRYSLTGQGGLLAFPIRNEAGLITSVRQRNSDDALNTAALEGKHVGKYLAVSSSHYGGATADCSPFFYAPSEVLSYEVCFVEGEIKAIILAEASGRRVIGLLGHSFWRLGVDMLQRLEPKPSKVYLGLDNDYEQNDAVFGSYLGCWDALKANGQEVERLTWPAEYKGPDDAILAGGELCTVAAPPSRQPRPLPTNVNPPFPVDKFFEAVPAARDIIKSMSATYQVDAGLVAIHALQCLALPITAAFGAVSWHTYENEPLCLQSMVIADSGCGKSAPFNKLNEPLKEQQEREREAYEAQARDNASRKAVLNKKRDRLIDKCSQIEPAKENAANPEFNAQASYQAEIKVIDDELANIPERSRSLYEEADKTPEAYPEIIKANGGRITVFSDEGKMLWDRLGGQYSATKTTDATPLIKGWDGNQDWRVDRKGRPPVNTGPFRTQVSVMIQSDFWRGIHKAFDGQGAVSRFLLYVAERWPNRVSRNPKLDLDAWLRFRDLTAQLLLLTSAQPRFDAAAVDAMHDLRQSLINRAGSQGVSDRMRSWLAKAENNAIRLAGILATIEAMADPARRNLAHEATVSVATVDRVAALMECLCEHARIALDGKSEDPVLSAARDVLAVSPTMSEVTWRNLQKKNSAKFTNDRRGDVDEAFKLLVRLGHLRRKPSKQAGDVYLPQAAENLAAPFEPFHISVCKLGAASAANSYIRSNYNDDKEEDDMVQNLDLAFLPETYGTCGTLPEKPVPISVSSCRKENDTLGTLTVPALAEAGLSDNLF